MSFCLLCHIVGFACVDKTSTTWFRVPLFWGTNAFFWDTTFREGGAYFGIQKTFFWTQKNFCWIQKTFFGDTKNFFRVKKCFFRAKNSKNTTFFFFKKQKMKKKKKNKEKIFLIFLMFFFLVWAIFWFDFLSAFFQFLDFVVDFLIFWSGRREERDFWFLHFLLFFLLWVKERGFFFDFFTVFCFFFDHFCPAPLLAHTTFGPDRLLAQTTFFDQTVLCPNLCEPSLTPKNLGQWAAVRDNLLLMSCFLGHGPPCAGHPLPKTTLCGNRCCGVGASKIWALPPTPPPLDPFTWLPLSPIPSPPPGFHTTAREPKRAHLRVPVFNNTTKISRNDLQERKK